MKRFRTLYAEDQLNVFEERMYALLSEVNSVKGHVHTPPRAGLGSINLRTLLGKPH